MTDWVTEWVSEWHGHLLSCSGNFKQQLLLWFPPIACCNLSTDCQHNSLADICPDDSGHNYSAIYLMGGPFFSCHNRIYSNYYKTRQWLLSFFGSWPNLSLLHSIQDKTRSQINPSYQCRKLVKLKVVKWCWKKLNGPIFMHIYDKYCIYNRIE